ncbi:MAG: RNA methyltransferase [Flavobacteriales bacterium]|nr:RNA methyltransferase [Flavobacteriales bacterium]
MITKNELKLIRSLKDKKNREKEGLFIVEGEKILNEMLRGGLDVVRIFSLASLDLEIEAPVVEISEKELKQASALISPHDLIALVKIPAKPANGPDLKGFIVALDDIQDPGNMGTILRSADWFGFNTVLCSLATVDVYNSKVVQASMGSVARVSVVYTDLLNQLRSMKSSHNIYGGSLRGSNAYEINWPEDSVLLIGNEAAGLGTKYDSVIDEHVTISTFGRAESLNAAVAFSVLSYEYRRQH